MTTTATVETLTAEVRVLVVGNRQVTLSVFKQLDWVPAVEMTPFGRVSSGRKRDSDARQDGVELVGVGDTGSLVQSAVWPVDWTQRAPRVFDHWCEHQKARYANPVDVRKSGGHTLRWRHGEFSCRVQPLHEGPCWKHGSSESWFCEERKYQHQRGDFCNLPALEQAWQNKADDDLAVASSGQSLYDAMSALPLIVLAGLR